MENYKQYETLCGEAPRITREMTLVASDSEHPDVNKTQTLEVEFECDGITITDALYLKKDVIHVGQKYLVEVAHCGIESIAEKPFSNHEKVRGVFGYIRRDGHKDLTACIMHVFADGHLLVSSHIKGFYGIFSAEDFTSSRDAYYSCGCFVPALWHADTARCLNAWFEYDGNENNGFNKMTDEQARELATYCFMSPTKKELLKATQPTLEKYLDGATQIVREMTLVGVSDVKYDTLVEFEHNGTVIADVMTIGNGFRKCLNVGGKYNVSVQASVCEYPAHESRFEISSISGPR